MPSRTVDGIFYVLPPATAQASAAQGVPVEVARTPNREPEEEIGQA